MLIYLEGMDGSGKTTLGRLLAEKLRGHGYQVLETREPSNSYYGQELRRSAFERRSPLEEYWLFMLDRAHHTREVVGPALDRGEIVLSDRGYTSTMLYQGPLLSGLQGDTNFSHFLRRVQTEALTVTRPPGLVIFLQLSVEEALRRTMGRSGAHDGFETAENLRRVLRASESVLDVVSDACPVLLFDAEREGPEQLAESSLDAIRQLLGR
jgi:dTMP kinase